MSKFAGVIIILGTVFIALGVVPHTPMRLDLPLFKERVPGSSLNEKCTPFLGVVTDYEYNQLARQVSVMRHRQAILREEVRKNRERISVLYAAIKRLEQGQTAFPPPFQETRQTDPWWWDIITFGFWILVAGGVIWLLYRVVKGASSQSS